MRMRVQGRMQDFGPAATFVATVSSSGCTSHDPEDLLPPDYDQATEPFPHLVTVPVVMSPPLRAPLPLPPTGGR